MCNNVSSMLKTLIFDFDGTIADTFKELVNIVLAKRKSLGVEKITEEEIMSFRDMKSQDAIKKWGVPAYKIPMFVLKIRDELHKSLTRIKPIEGLKESIRELHSKGYRLGILTSNAEDNVRLFLKNNEITDFNFIYSGINIWGKDRILVKMMRELKINKVDVVYIGDETRDIEAAKKVGIKVAAVTWGFQSEALLSSLKPDFLVRKPTELLNL